MNTKLLRILSRVLFFLGVTIGVALSGIAIWNNIESTSYYFSGVKYAPFRGLQCPLMIAPTENGMVTAVFKNPTDEEDNFLYRAEISGKASLTRQVEGQIAVPSNESKSIRLTVDARDVDLLFFILVKMTILPNAVHPSQEAVCGIMLVDILGLTGTQISMITLILCLLGITVGLGLWHQTSGKPYQGIPRIVQVLGLAVLLALLAASMQWWTIAIALCVIAILLMVISLRFGAA